MSISKKHKLSASILAGLVFFSLVVGAARYFVPILSITNFTANDSTIAFSFSANEEGTLYYGLKLSTTLSPDNDDLEAGTGFIADTDGFALYPGSGDIDDIGDLDPVSIGSLSLAEQDYTFYAVFKNGADEFSTIHTEEIKFARPELAVGYPQDALITKDGFTFKVEYNRSGTLYVAAFTTAQGGITPSQIKTPTGNIDLSTNNEAAITADVEATISKSFDEALVADGNVFVYFFVERSDADTESTISSFSQSVLATPPSITNASIAASPTRNEFRVNFDLNKDATVFYALSSSASPPSKGVIDGTSPAAAPVLAVYDASLAAGAVFVEETGIAGLSSQTYYVHLFARDAGDNESNIITVSFVNDVTPPAFTDGTPIRTDFGATFAIFRVRMDKAGTIHYRASTNGSLYANSAELRDDAGKESIVYSSVGSDLQIVITGLSPNTANYRVYFTAEDALGNLTPLFQSPTFNTPAAEGVSITRPSPLELCVGGSFQSLGNIVIRENSSNDFRNTSGSNRTLTFTLPSGLEFNTGATTTISLSSPTNMGPPNPPSVSYPANNQIRLTINVSNTNHIDFVTIGGVQVRALSAISGGNRLVRTGGNADVFGFNFVDARFDDNYLAEFSTVSPSLSLGVSDTDICQGEEVTFTASAGYGTYVWLVNGQVVPSVSGDEFVTSSLSNNDEVSYRVNAGSCEVNSPVQKMIVRQAPEIFVNPSFSPSAEICSNEQISINVLGPANTSYVFAFNSVSVVGNEADVTLTSNSLTAGPAFLSALPENNTLTVIGINNTTTCESEEFSIAFIVKTAPASPSLQAGLQTTFSIESPSVNLMDYVDSPTGGTWSGSGVINNRFFPESLPPDSYPLVYTVSVDGCNVSSSLIFNTFDPNASIVGEGILDNSQILEPNYCQGESFNGNLLRLELGRPQDYNNTVSDETIFGIDPCFGLIGNYTRRTTVNYDLGNVTFSGPGVTQSGSDFLFDVEGLNDGAANLQALIPTFTEVRDIYPSGCQILRFASNSTTFVGREIIVFSSPNLSIDGISDDYCLDDATVYALRVFDGGNEAPSGDIYFSQAFEESDPVPGPNTIKSQNFRSGAKTFSPEALVSGLGSVTTPKVFYLVAEFTNANNCTSFSEVQSIRVNPLPQLSLLSFSSAYCEDIPSIVINPRVNGVVPPIQSNVEIAISPAGQNDYTSIPDRILRPVDLGPGAYDLRFQYMDGIGCSNELITAVQINPLPVLNFTGLLGAASFNLDADNGFCIDEPVLELQAFANGSLITDPAQLANVQFAYKRTTDPTFQVLPNGNLNIAGNLTSGLYDVRMRYTDGNGCASELNKEIEIFPLPTASLSTANNITNLCAEDSPLLITGISNATGATLSFSPLQGLTDNGDGTATFDPSAITIGDTEVQRTIVFNVSDVNGCTNSSSLMLTIYPTPTVSLEVDDLGPLSNNQYCVDGDEVNLTGFPTDSNGVYAGRGLVDNGNGTAVFNPAVAHADAVRLGLVTANQSSTHPISYTYTDQNGCSASSQITLTVNPLPQISFSGLNDARAYCIDAARVELFGVPALVSADSAAFFGTGVQQEGDRYFFNPAIAGATGGRFFEISYYFRNANLCDRIVSQTVEVFPLPEVSISGLQDAYCISQSDVTLTGFPTNGTFSGPGIVPGTSTFRASLAEAGTHNVTYTFTNDNGCTNSITRQVIVRPLPVAGFSFSNQCDGVATSFTDESFVPEGGGEISSWSWDFGDQQSGSANFSSEPNPSHTFSTPGTYNVSLRVQTDFGCNSVLISRQIIVGPVPVADFNWSQLCAGTATQFSPKQAINIPGFSDQNDVLSWTWNFGDGSPELIITDFNARNVSHTYSQAGTYEVSMSIETSNNCLSDTTLRISILPKIILGQNGYFNDFEQENNDFFVEAAANSAYPEGIWERALPSQDPVIQSAFSGQFAMVSQNGENYRINDKSFANCPCLDIRSLERPMLSMAIFRDLEDRSDGVVVQYSIDGGNVWTLLGEIGEGRNWYNRNALPGNPGNQALGQFGWSGSPQEWEIARFYLDTIPMSARENVRFRVAFGSDAQSLGDFTGFAFDDFFVGNRTRQVLAEVFTNTNSQAAQMGRQRIIAFENAREADMISLFYHTDFPSSDVFNQSYPQGPSARVLSYGVNQVPAEVWDGTPYANASFNNRELNIRSLFDPEFDLEVTFGEGEFFNMEARMTALQSYADSVVLMAAVVENGITIAGQNYRQVLRKFLPNAAGSFAGSNWTIGQSRSFSFEWELTNVIEPENIAVILFAQNARTREVLQAYYAQPIGRSYKKQEVTSAEELIRQFTLYPNPSTDVLNVSFGTALPMDLQWEVHDQTGRLLKQGKAFAQEEHMKVETQDFKNGVYLLRFIGEGGYIHAKRFIVLH